MPPVVQILEGMGCFRNSGITGLVLPESSVRCTLHLWFLYPLPHSPLYFCNQILGEGSWVIDSSGELGCPEGLAEALAPWWGWGEPGCLARRSLPFHAPHKGKGADWAQEEGRHSGWRS